VASKTSPLKNHSKNVSKNHSGRTAPAASKGGKQKGLKLKTTPAGFEKFHEKSTNGAAPSSEKVSGKFRFFVK
jgi:hypothetical protein